MTFYEPYYDVVEVEAELYASLNGRSYPGLGTDIFPAIEYSCEHMSTGICDGCLDSRLSGDPVSLIPTQ